MPEPVAPAAPAASASSGSSVSSAAPTPVAAPVSAPAPVAPAAGAPAEPAVAPAVPSAAPAAPVAPAGPPKSSDFPDTADGFTEWVMANEKWKMDHPDGEAAPDAVQPVAEPKPGDEAPKPAEAQPAAEVSPATPQALDEWTTKDPAFKAALDGNPELKGQVMSMARVAAAAQPILDIIPTIEDATFAVDTSRQFIGLRSDFMMAPESPELGEQAWGNFVSLFHETDDAGKPILDAAGQPKLGQDFDFIAQKFTTGALGSKTTEVESGYNELKKRVDSGVYPNQAAKDADVAKLQEAEYSLAAYKYVAENLLGAAEEDKLPDLPADATPEQRAFQERLKAQQDELNKTKQSNSKNGRVEARQKFEGEMNQSWGAGVGEELDNWMTAARARGEFIPQVVLEQKWVNPKTNQVTNISNFAAQVQIDFNRRVNSIPTVLNKLKELNALPVGEPARQARAAYASKLRSQYLKPIIEAHVKRIQDGIREQSAASGQREQRVGEIARVEPNTGSPVTPKSLTEAQITEKARTLAQQDPAWSQMSSSEQYSAMIVAAERVRYGL